MFFKISLNNNKSLSHLIIMESTINRKLEKKYLLIFIIIIFILSLVTLSTKFIGSVDISSFISPAKYFVTNLIPPTMVNFDLSNKFSI